MSRKMSTMIDFSQKKKGGGHIFHDMAGTKHFHVQEVPFTINDLAKTLRSPDSNFAAADVVAQVKHDLVIEISRTAAPNSSSHFKKHSQNNFLHLLFSFQLLHRLQILNFQK